MAQLAGQLRSCWKNGLGFTEKQAHEIMAHINKNLRERQIEYGWGVLAALCDQIEDEFPFLIKPRFQRLNGRKGGTTE